MEPKTNLSAQISNYQFATAIIATIFKQQDWANLWRVVLLQIKFHAAKLFVAPHSIRASIGPFLQVQINNNKSITLNKK